MNAAEDGHAGIQAGFEEKGLKKAWTSMTCNPHSDFQELGGNATMLFYLTEEGNEGRRAYLEKRAPDFTKFKRLP